MTKNLTRTSVVALLAALTVMSVSAVRGVRLAAGAEGAAEATQGATGDRATFVGTYRLVTIEAKDPASGEWAQRPNFNSIGYITYADTGHMGVHIMARSRQPFASNPPTGDEAQAALGGYTAYFGSFTVDDAAQFVVHHRFGQINPGGAVDAKRFYDFEGDRLTLMPAPSDGGGRDKVTSRLVWERLPNAPLSDAAKQFVGFHRLLYTDRYREKDGEVVFHGERNYARAGTSYIIYTPTGHMMVHLMQKEGRTRYAGNRPTPDESLKAFQSYGGYFGRFTTYENYDPPFLMHNQDGTIRPARDVDATKRFYEFTGDVLRLGGPPRLNEAGEMAGGHLYWERQPPIE
jgi:hypothetical protein